MIKNQFELLLDFRKWQKENKAKVYLYSNELMVEEYFNQKKGKLTNFKS